MLRDLRPGATLFVLDKKQRKIGQAVVTNNVQNMPQFTPQMQQTQTINLSFKYDNRDIVFVSVNATAASFDDASGGSGLVVCESNEALLNEIKSWRNYNEAMLAQQPYFKENSAWCESQMLELDPVQKVKAESQQQMNEMMSRFQQLFDAMKAENDDLRSRLDSQDIQTTNKKGK